MNPNVRQSPQYQPTPQQLEQIVKLGTLLAKENGTVKRSPTRAHVFLPDWVDRPLLEEDYCVTMHRIAGRIGRIGYKAYHLWLRESFSYVEGEAVDVIGERTFTHDKVDLSDFESGYVNLYKFRWTHRHVLDATRYHRRFKRRGRGLTAIKREDGGIDKTVLVSAPMEVIDLAKHREEVTQADCDALINQLRNFREPGQQAA